MVAALRCVRPQFQWYQLAYATEIKSIQLHDSIIRLSQKIVSFTVHYIAHKGTKLHTSQINQILTSGYDNADFKYTVSANKLRCMASTAIALKTPDKSGARKLHVSQHGRC